MQWIARQLRYNHLFRRILLTYFTGLYTYVTLESFTFAYFAINKGLSADDTITVLGGLQLLMTLLMGYVFKVYAVARSTVDAT